jgi:hypothetical protein
MEVRMVAKGYCQVCKQSVAPEDPDRCTSPDGRQDGHKICVMKVRKPAIIAQVKAYLAERGDEMRRACFVRLAGVIRGDHHELVQAVAHVLEDEPGRQRFATLAFRTKIGRVLLTTVPTTANAATIDGLRRKVAAQRGRSIEIAID